MQTKEQKKATADAIAATHTNLAERCLKAREQTGLSRRALATTAGIHEDVLQRIERGQRLPTVATLVALATALGVPTSRLLETDIDP